MTSPYHPTNAPVEVLYEDEDILVVIKPANLLTVPGRGAEKKDCAEYRLFKDGRKFVRAAHRLDQDTSGILVFGASPAGHRALSMMFEARAVSKTYEAVCRPLAPLAQQQWTIDLPLALDWPNRPKHHVDPAGKPAQTGVEVLAERDGLAHLRLTPITGRSHQLRVHLAHTDLPILGDPLYSPPEAAGERLHLHACGLSFEHPFTQEALAFTSPPPFLDSAGFAA